MTYQITMPQKGRGKSAHFYSHIAASIIDRKHFDAVFCQSLYESGESVSNYNYFQVVISGNLSISFIRDDGSAYSLSNGGKNYIIGEMDLLVVGNDNVLAEAISPLLTIAIDTVQYKDKLLHNIAFLQLMATTLANKISVMTNADAAPSSLSERILNYMKFKCDNHILSGIEKTAFRLHCSPRQLQRILNQFEKDNVVTKIGKGRYIMKN